MKFSLFVCVSLFVFSASLLAGPAGDYVGLTTVKKWIYEELVADSSFGYPNWTVTRDTIPYDSVSVSDFFTLDGKTAYERYYFKRHSDGSTEELRDTLYENGSDVWLKIPLFTIDTAALAYKTPLSVGNSWEMGIGGEYVGDYDSDGTNDTVTVSHDSSYVVSRGNYTVPAGTFDAFEIHRLGRVEVSLSSGTNMIEWVYSFERFVPRLGIIYDSTVIVDSVSGFETHWKFDVIRLQAYTGISERECQTEPYIKGIITKSSTLKVNGLRGSYLYSVDGTLIGKDINGTVTLPGKGVFFLRGVDKNHRSVIIKIIRR